jgi:triosephosphate isomerase (TIM)
MADRKRLVAGNWKMNGLRAAGVALAGELARRARETEGGGPACDMLVCPPATLLSVVHAAFAGSAVALGGQDCHAEPRGAHTGDISAEMLADAGCTHVILGHSERRQLHRETDADIHAKMLAARRAGLAAILCVGETLPQREGGHAIDVVSRQLDGSIPTNVGRDGLIVAYEPVWAIGTGRSATPDDIARMHAAIRARLSQQARILYGGSVNPGNAASILSLENVDGVLVGGASLVADDFWSIVRCCR